MCRKPCSQTQKPQQSRPFSAFWCRIQKDCWYLKSSLSSMVCFWDTKNVKLPAIEGKSSVNSVCVRGCKMKEIIPFLYWEFQLWEAAGIRSKHSEKTQIITIFTACLLSWEQNKSFIQSFNWSETLLLCDMFRLSDITSHRCGYQRRNNMNHWVINKASCCWSAVWLVWV